MGVERGRGRRQRYRTAPGLPQSPQRHPQAVPPRRDPALFPYGGRRLTQLGLAAKVQIPLPRKA